MSFHSIKRLGGLALGVGLLGLGGCVVVDGAPYPGHRGGGYYAPDAGIPEGHLPPPGECRIWYHDRSPGHQPPPGSCAELRYHVPPGASLIRG